MVSNKISCVACCAVGATTLVLENSGVEEIVKWNITDDAPSMTVPGMIFADVTIVKKEMTVDFKSRVPKTTVLSVPIAVPSLEEFPAVPSVPAKVKSVLTKR